MQINSSGELWFSKLWLEDILFKAIYKTGFYLGVWVDGMVWMVSIDGSDGGDGMDGIYWWWCRNLIIFLSIQPNN